MGVRVVGADADQPAKAGLQHIDALEPFRQHRMVVQQLGIVRQPIELARHEIEGFLDLVCIA